MTNYQYSREMVNDQYNINNPLRVDGQGAQIRLSTEIMNALPNKYFKIKMSGESVTISFVDPLTNEEKTTLDQVVQNHKDNE